MELETAILHILSSCAGRESRITRSNLRWRVSGLTGKPVSDRALRRAIEVLRATDKRGAYICSSSQGGGGYWLATDLNELRAHLAEERRRGMTILSGIHAQAARAGVSLSGQLDLNL